MSRSLIALPQDIERFADLHFVSTSRNAVLGLTGFLIATSTHFAQYLEGEQAALDEVMASIRTDPRHVDLCQTDFAPSVQRRFPFWRMACFAPTSDARRHVDPMLKWYGISMLPDAANELVEFMQYSANTVTGSYLVL